MGVAIIEQPLAALDIEQANAELRGHSAQAVVAWALGLGLKPFMTTSFGPNSALMLHLVSSVDASVPVVWVDSGYNLRDTYIVAEKLMQLLPLNMQVYTPRMSAERWNSLYGGIPQLDEPELHEQFTRSIKLEPFERAIAELRPELWLTGIRRGETDFRGTLDTVSWDARRGILRVAPIFDWSDADIAAYMQEHALPSCRHYFDPTKVLDNRECGIHTGL